ncbi:hypothetical protein [Petroclostridium sp. X23]|uniref:hypothetical protein n=1 Tax=Petroclostridium sp. X23 TaxID=3045146 RepID=UPI0024AD2042|nr:hypothetical protein [Petroclostridium sp. X23]WHH58364.1 hypothetical protein QKW49_21580 [Petroclostridium sp. X23]
MITSLIKSGFGHSVRFIAMVENLRKYSDEKISYLAPECMQKFIESNVANYNCKPYDLYYYLALMEEKAVKPKKNMKKGDQKLIQQLQKSSVLIDDFFLYARLRKLFSNKTITCGLYHGDISISKNDSKEVVFFKNGVCKRANQHDVFFHINLEQPKNKPDIKCMYIPIPIITRQVSMSKQSVNRLLGLSPDEKFILVHAGAAVSTNVYKKLYPFYDAINRLKSEHRIVIAGSIDNHEFPFHSGIIKAPIFYNGIDLVNASELVISKPGMGILQDCIAAKKKLLFVPADSPERDVKIDLLNKLLSNNLPIINKISASNLGACISECFSMEDIYVQSFAKVPTNGADVLAKDINILKDTKKSDLAEAVSLIRKERPFIV